LKSILPAARGLRGEPTCPGEEERAAVGDTGRENNGKVSASRMACMEEKWREKERRRRW